MLDTWHKDIRQTLKDTVTELRHDACRIYCGYIMVLKREGYWIKYLKIQNSDDIRIQDKRRKEG